jgi:hypothetical protein
MAKAINKERRKWGGVALEGIDRTTEAIAFALEKNNPKFSPTRFIQECRRDA